MAAPQASTDLFDLSVAAHSVVLAAYTAAGAPAPADPAGFGFALWFVLPPTAAEANAIKASVEKALGPNYVVGIGKVFISVEYRPPAA